MYTGFTISIVGYASSSSRWKVENSYESAQYHDERPSYVSMDGQRFVYYLATHSDWFISSRLGSSSSYAHNPSRDHDVPSAGWRLYTNEWVDVNLLFDMQGICASDIHTRSSIHIDMCMRVRKTVRISLSCIYVRGF